jgi:hypothetical protein
LFKSFGQEGIIVKGCGLRLLILLGLPLVAAEVHAAISYSLSDPGSGNWQYSYAATNDTVNVPIEEFSIHFPFGKYDSLAIATASPNWSILTIQPRSALRPIDGCCNGLTFSTRVFPEIPKRDHRHNDVRINIAITGGQTDAERDTDQGIA